MKPLWWRHGTIIAFLDALIPSSIWTCPDISHAQDTMLAAAAAAAERKTQAPKPPEAEAAMEAHEEALAEDDLMLAEGEEEDVIEDDRIVDLREWIFMFLIGAAVAQGALRENIGCLWFSLLLCAWMSSLTNAVLVAVSLQEIWSSWFHALGILLFGVFFGQQLVTTFNFMSHNLSRETLIQLLHGFVRTTW